MDAYYSIAKSVAAARLAGRKTPLFVSWAVTYRCERHCGYCSLWENPPAEIPTKEALGIIGEFQRVGTRMITFTGGEPLLRGDIAELAARCRELGIIANLNTNGFFLKERSEILKYVDSVTLSLDGPPEIDDSIRGSGAHEKFTEAAGIVRRNKKKLCITTVVTKANINHLDYVIKTCNDLSCGISIHPMFTGDLLHPTGDTALRPSPEEFRASLDRLIETVKKNPALFKDSLSSLEHMLNWPERAAVPCYAGLLFCRLTPDGKLKACEWKKLSPDDPAPDALALGVKEALAQLRRPDCAECWNPPVVDANRAAAGDLRTIFHLMKRKL